MLEKFVYRDSTKHTLKRVFVEGRGRVVGKPMYNGTIASELAFHRSIDALAGRPLADQAFLEQCLTAVIKTFERPKVLERLVRSIRRFHPGLPVIVVDDSRSPRRLPGVETVEMPFDSGISAGRNEGVRRVGTPYTLLLDDDYVFFRGTGLAQALGAMVAEPRIDIMGGARVDLPFYRVYDNSRAALFPTDAKPLLPAGSQVGGFRVQDKVANFFIARTGRLREVPWDENLKRIEHADFFTRARGVLLTVYNPALRCLHAPALFDRPYMAIRGDNQAHFDYLRRKWGLP